MKTDTEHLSEMDIQWLLNNGWTIPGNLAYRRILESFNQTGVLQQERIEQILMQYQVEEFQIHKIKQVLTELIELKREFASLPNRETEQ